IVASPEYPCQLVLVVKLAAVLKADVGSTAPKCCGLNGSTCCSRCMRYVTTRPTALKTSNANAYCFHVCSFPGSTPASRQQRRSSRPNDRGSGCRRPSKQRNS